MIRCSLRASSSLSSLTRTTPPPSLVRLDEGRVPSRESAAIRASEVKWSGHKPHHLGFGGMLSALYRRRCPAPCTSAWAAHAHKTGPPGRAGRQSLNNSKLAPAATGWAGETGGITKRASPSSSMSQLDQNGSPARSQKMGVGIDSLSVVWVPLEVIVWSGRGRVAAVAHVADDGAGRHRTERTVA